MSENQTGTQLHPLLLRQLRRAGIPVTPEPIPATVLVKLLEKVSEFYSDAEEDRHLLERSIDLSSREMEALNRRLETERNRLNTLLTTTEDCVCTLNKQGGVIWGNPAALRLLGTTIFETSAGQQPLSFFSQLDTLQNEGPAAAALEKGSQHRRALLRNRAGMLPTPITYLLNEIAGADEEGEYFVVVFRDITAEQAHEQDLRNAQEAAKAASKAKSELLANVSHEVRTPLHGILGMAEVLLMEGGLNRNQTDCLYKLQTSAKDLLHVLNDILDLSKIEAGRLTIEVIPFLPEAILQQVQQLIEPQARAKGLELRCRVVPRLSVSVLGDPTRLRQIILNLASNAVKFTERGFVELSLRSETETNALVLHFQVLDSGIGIPAQQHKSIFEAFSQADGSITRRFGGTGLGLAICSRLAHMMNGDLTVESEPGHGSAFRFALRLAVAPEKLQAALAEPVASNLPPLRILYAEDNHINQLTGRKMLRSRGHSVQIVANGREAVQAVKEQEYDVILMDHQMPEMSGVEASRAIRAMGFTLPIVAASADAMLEDRRRFAAAGMDGFIGKPFTIAELETEIARVLSSRLTGTPQVTPNNRTPVSLYPPPNSSPTRHEPGQVCSGT